jgi:Neprosin
MVSHAAESRCRRFLAHPSDPPMNEDGHVSISRRGLLAAGLTAAVIGSIGVASMINANADDTPAPPAATQADETTAVAKPPALLPWRERPGRLKRGRPGANSQQLAAAGDDVAPKDTSGSLVPRPEWAPKGRYSKGGGLRQESTSVKPPAPPRTGTLAEPPPVTDNAVNYFYAVGSQVGDSDGAYANVVIAKPDLAKGDYHTLAEISVQSLDGGQIVEVGWSVDRTVNGDDDPHLFVYHWVNGAQTCYNACGYQAYSKTTVPGDTLPVNVSKRFGIQHSGGYWWIAYDTEWIGYFPDSLWDGQYTRSGVQQFFGEVASSSTKPCSEMGNGVDANKDTAARFGSITQLNGPDPSVSVKTIGPDSKNGSPYPAVQLSARTFRFGGPGVC